MVKHLLLVFWLMLTAGLASAQEEATVDISKVVFKRSGLGTAGVQFGAGMDECKRLLGAPDRISDYYSEMDEDTMKIFHYGECTLSFLADRLEGCDLNDDRIRLVQTDGLTFKVGDKLSATTTGAARFHHFPVTHVNGNSRNMYFKSACIIGLNRGKTPTDSRLELLFNSNDRLFSIAVLD